jgi:hypothetical protein
VNEVRRVLQVGGKFLCNPYSDRHRSYVSGSSGPDVQICFYGQREVNTLFVRGWNLLSVQHVEMVEERQPQYTVHAEWRVIVEKMGRS